MSDKQEYTAETGIELIADVMAVHVRTIMLHYLCGIKEEKIPTITARDLAEFILKKHPPENPEMIDGATIAVEISILKVMRAITDDLQGGKPDYSMN